ncbi:hypothetical protein PROVRUST_07675 [Providencia rustigianii DSM 4541]|uniref:Uncharacterized protein n=1 Tax=Providencia rustigianii DSM 4541 TaxID=500637 RepID=D1P611_9GAMM|nr:hypothetical protein PROVRUST_07675 [Providencia rustigianii DSM 4541]
MNFNFNLNHNKLFTCDDLRDWFHNNDVKESEKPVDYTTG